MMTRSNRAGRVLVYLANGVQGGASARAALRQGFRVRALVRNAQAARALAKAGAEIAVGDLGDPGFLAGAHAGVSHVVLQFPLGVGEAAFGLADMAITAARSAGVETLLLKLASASRPTPCDEPSFVVNAELAARVRASGLPHAIVRPTMYLDNLLKPGVRIDIARRGVFELPMAADQRIAWVSADDVAEASVALLERPDGGEHVICGAESVTGPDFMAAISKGLGRKVAFLSQSVESFEREVAHALGPDLARGVASKFRFFRDHPAEADAILATPFRPDPALPGFRPETIEIWAARHRGAFFSTG